MRARHTIPLLGLLASMCVCSAGIYRAWNARDDAGVFLCGFGLAFFLVLLAYVARAARADWLCRTLTGQWMPPRRKN